MNDSAPVFVRVLASALYEIPSTDTDLGWCGYLLGTGDTPTNDPITIDQSLNNFSGSYLFALQSPTLTVDSDVEKFIASVRNYISNSYGKQTTQVCMWMKDPDNLPAKDISGSYDFAFTQYPSYFVLQSNLNNPIDLSITFSVQQNAVISTYEQGLTLGSLGGSNSISFQTNSGGVQYGPTIDPNQIYIPFSGAYKGCFLFSGAITPDKVLASFQAGFQYAHANNDNENSSDSIQNYPLFLTDNSQPNFNYIGSLDLIDPLNLGKTTVNLETGQLRTLFAPTGSSPLASWLQTNTNQSISLVPLLGGDGAVTSGPAPNSGAFAFEFQLPVTPNNSDFYLTPVGDFALAVNGVPLSGSGAAATNDLLCGIFGSETISFRSYATDAAFDFLRFTPHQNAYAPVFPFTSASLENIGSADQSRLTNIYQTSWAVMVNGENGDVRYRAQPEASPLFSVAGANNAVADSGISILSSYNPDVKLPAANFCFPLVPYTGFAKPPNGFSASDLSDFESQIISPTRKQLISEKVTPHLKAMKQMRLSRMAAAAQEDPPILPVTTATTTPQGLLAAVESGDSGTDYIKVTLAISDSPSGISSNMAFNNVESELQNLLQTNQLFSVVVNPQYLGDLLNGNSPAGDTPSFENTATIAGWTFTAEIGEGATATDYRNVMIFKFCDGTVQDWVNNPNKWISSNDFSVAANAGDSNVALVGLSAWLQEYIQAAIDASATSTLYDNFVKNIVTNPNWNGILVLRADVDTSGFPEQIKGLAAGIDQTLFEAHHFGATVSRVSISGNDITMQSPSSLFGLIDYQQPLFRQNLATGGNLDSPVMVPISGDYGFTVLQLQALFNNAALVDFRSRIQLNVNKLFGSAVKQTFGQNGQSPVSAVVLKGSYQKQGATSTYVFQQDNPTVFTLDSNILQAVTFDHIQFNTLTADSGGSQSTIQSRFLIWGMLDFAVLSQTDKSDFDALSFGSPEGTEAANLGAGLSFSNLQVNLQSPVATPNAINYTFAAGGLAFDFASSSLRKDKTTGAITDNLFSDLSLQIDSFIASSDDKRPSDFGYLPVQAKMSLTAISGEWYGIAYKVTMGTPGALVSGAGFESRMLLAWSPQTGAAANNYSVFAGLSLPGAAPGAKLLSLQGILKVSIDSIRLTRDIVQGSTDSAFVLRLNNIGLKFLGFVKLPPGATINFFLFGAPQGKGSLGWYAAYIEDSSSKQESLSEAEDVSNLIPLTGAIQQESLKMPTE